jgi:uncharacterized protein
VFSKKDYIIEFNKLKDGPNDLTFRLNDEFVQEISGHTANLSCSIDANLILQKRPSMFELHFQLDGTLVTTCDRCLKELVLPVSSEANLIIKISEFERYDDDEIVYVTPQTIQYDVSQFLYDTLFVSMPLQKTCEMANEKCDQETQVPLDTNSPQNDDATDPRWEQLKKLF